MGLPIGFGDAEHQILAQLAAVGWFNGVVQVLGWASPMGVSWHLPSPLQGHLRELVAKRAGEHEASVHSSIGIPRKWAKSLGNGGVSHRSLVRSKQTCFFAKPWGEHSVTDPGGEWGCPIAYIEALLGQILLTSLLLNSYCWAADEVY